MIIFPNMGLPATIDQKLIEVQVPVEIPQWSPRSFHIRRSSTNRPITRSGLQSDLQESGRTEQSKEYFYAFDIQR